MTFNASEEESAGVALHPSVSRFFRQQGWHERPATYAYDFGDDWQHVIVHEGLEPADDLFTYPRCVAGEGRCPPEDCGGVHGYAVVRAAIADPGHEGMRRCWSGLVDSSTRAHLILRR